jgi:hypothetical protein
MSQIEINILKQGNQFKNVISISFFTMKNSYRPVEAYKQHLKTFMFRKKALKDFETRIYTDDSGKDIALELADENTTVIHYNCEFFREGDGHTGTFGTIVRFLPLFEKGLETVWISDIDIDSSFLDMNVLTAMKNNKCDIFIDSILCYERKPWVNVKYPIIAYRFISNIIFPKQIFTRFLNNLIDGKMSKLIDELNEYNSPRKTPNQKFPYGMDEVFLNGPVYNSIQRQDVKVIFRKDYFTQSFLSYNIEGFPEKLTNTLKRYYRKPDLELLKKVKDIYKEYAPMLVDEYPCMQELIDKLPSFKKSLITVTIFNSSVMV